MVIPFPPGTIQQSPDCCSVHKIVTDEVCQTNHQYKNMTDQETKNEKSIFGIRLCFLSYPIT
jgi:hypothetical protein